MQVPRRRALWLLGSVVGVCLLLGWLVYPWGPDYAVQPEVKFLGYEWDRTQPVPMLEARFQIVNRAGGPISFREPDSMAAASLNMTSGQVRVVMRNDGARIESLAADREKEITVQIPWTQATNARPPTVEMRFAYWEGVNTLVGVSNFLPDGLRDSLRAKLKMHVGRGKVVIKQFPPPELTEQSKP